MCIYSTIVLVGKVPICPETSKKEFASQPQLSQAQKAEHIAKQGEGRQGQTPSDIVLGYEKAPVITDTQVKDTNSLSPSQYSTLTKLSSQS